MPARRRYLIPAMFWLALGLSWPTVAQIPTLSRQDKTHQAWLAQEPYISDIIIEGNLHFSDGQIRSRMFSRENSFLQSLASDKRHRVLRYTIYRDTLEIKYLYLRAGFINVGISEEIDFSPTDSSAVIKVTINEGERFLIRAVSLEANDSLPFYGELARLSIRLTPGDPIDPIAINHTEFDLKTVMANNGYPYALVSSSLDTSGGAGQALLIFRAEERDLVRFGRIVIDSLKYYDSSLVSREITFRPGEPYSRARIIESQKHLYSTGYFNSVSLDSDRKLSGQSGMEQPDLAPDFRFSALEQKPHFVSAKTGASQDSLQDLTWDFSASWGKRNFFASRRLELSLITRFDLMPSLRPILHRYQLKLMQPWMFDLRLPLTLTARFEPGVKSVIQPYRIQTWLVALSTRKDWSEQLYAVISGEYENVNIYGVSNDLVADIRRAENISVRRKLTVFLVRDTRSDKFVPRSGSYSVYYGQYVGGFLGGDESFMKFEFSWARYQLLVGPMVFATRVKTGWVKEFSSTHEVPINDRFYLGGASSIRGFRENIIGPRLELPAYQTVDSANVGANTYFIYNQELRFPLFSYRKLVLWGSVFTDLGNGWGSLSEINPADFLFSYGAGIQFITPAGPLRFDYAHHLENGIYSEGGRWHIAILYAF